MASASCKNPPEIPTASGAGAGAVVFLSLKQHYVNQKSPERLVRWMILQSSFLAYMTCTPKGGANEDNCSRAP